MLFVACNPSGEEKTPEWQKPPASYDVKGADLTFNEKRLDAFNSMTTSEREAHIEQLKTTEGGFRGQAVFDSGSELGASMDEAEFGKYEVVAEVAEAVLYEITISYLLYSDEDFHTGVPKGTHIEFTGTLAGFDFQDESKPRKLTIKVKDAKVDRLK